MEGRWKSYRARVRKMNAKHMDDFRRDTKKIFAERKTYNVKEDPLFMLWGLILSLPLFGMGILVIVFFGFLIWELLFG